MVQKNVGHHVLGHGRVAGRVLFVEECLLVLDLVLVRFAAVQGVVVVGLERDEGPVAAEGVAAADHGACARCVIGGAWVTGR